MSRRKLLAAVESGRASLVDAANGFDPDRGKPPAPKIAIVTCADPRLSNIEQMLGLALADVDMIRNFGTVIDDDAVRSLVLSTRLLGSSTTSTPGGSAKCSQAGRPSQICESA